MIAIFHFAAVAHYIFGVYYLFAEIAEKDYVHRKYEFGGVWIYLTYLTFFIQTLYFIVALLNDFAGTNETLPKKKPILRKLRDYLFAAFAVPLAIDVSGMFWLLYAIDRKLVLPVTMDEYFPGWFNHIVHTNIIIFIFIEMYWTYHSYPCYKSMLAGLGTFLVSYLVWVHIIKHFSGYWVYGVLDELDFGPRIAFFAFTCSLPIGLYFLGKFINRKIWESRLDNAAYDLQSKRKIK